MVLNKYDFSGDKYVAIELIKNTDEEWFPTLPNNTVKVRASFRPDALKTSYYVYFCAIGGGQYRYDLEYVTTIEKSAREKFEYWAKIVAELPDKVTKQMFKDLGLVEKTS